MTDIREQIEQLRSSKDQTAYEAAVTAGTMTKMLAVVEAARAVIDRPGDKWGWKTDLQGKYELSRALAALDSTDD